MLHPLPRLGHPVGDGGFPAEVMEGLLVGGEVFFRFVDLIEEKTGRVFLGLEDVEADVAGFVAGVLCVVENGGLERLDELGLDEDGDCDDEHGTPNSKFKYRNPKQ